MTVWIAIGSLAIGQDVVMIALPVQEQVGGGHLSRFHGSWERVRSPSPHPERTSTAAGMPSAARVGIIECASVNLIE